MKAGFFARLFSTVLDFIVVIILCAGVYYAAGQPIIKSSIKDFNEIYPKYQELSKKNDEKRQEIYTLVTTYTEDKEEKEQIPVSTIRYYKDLIEANYNKNVTFVNENVDVELNDNTLDRFMTLVNERYNIYKLVENSKDESKIDQNKLTEYDNQKTKLLSYYDDRKISETEKTDVINFLTEWYNYAYAELELYTVIFSEVDYYVAQSEINDDFYRAADPYAETVLNYYVATIFFYIYSFVALTLIYTVILKGKTVGRRLMKLKVTGRKTTARLIVHDVVLKYLPSAILIMYSPIAAIYIILILIALDFVFIAFNRDKLGLRDVLTGIHIEKNSYGY